MTKTDKSQFTIDPYCQKIEKPWGYELILTLSNSLVTGKVLHLNKGSRFSFQYHDEKQETLTLINGKCLLSLENSDGKIKEIEMEPFKGYLIQPLQKHRCQAMEACDIFEVSTGEKGETVRLEDDYKRGTETEEMRKASNRGWKKK